ncbi:cadherin-like beta sandwich domain-containing protein [Globicatella sulfidifaciens]|uniref:Cadherin-like beta-sandwich-like domain-containing protein n=1 Tax=Globicatella sulfidifaciens TaxID=136093 RepID=A0A7X8GZF1_9LACT|nr:cadherin-like beta sandwich domain-containing protein [Globicatella sulfidifaciens]NLJ17502.1 hypothetical protein [Globicatella sulfidifaciens]
MDYEKKIKRKMIALAIILSLIIPILTFNVLAVSAKFKLQTDKLEVKRGETFRIVVTTENIEEIKGGFNGYSGSLNYDTARFSRNKTETSVDGWNFVYNPKANTFLGNDPTGMDFKEKNIDVFTITFEVLPNAQLGESKIELKNLAISDASFRNINLSDSSLTITVVDDENDKDKSASSNNNLSNLQIEGYNLEPTFKSDTTVYFLELDNDVEEIKVKAQTEDGKSKILSGDGIHKLKEGKNIIVVSVKAEDGSIQNYTINVLKKANQKDEDENKKPDNNKPKDDKNGSPNDKNDHEEDGTKTDSNNSSNDKDKNNISQKETNQGMNSVNNSSSNNFVLDIQGIGNLDKNFEKDIYKYHSVVDRDTEKLEPIVTLEDSNATYELIGPDKLKLGKNEVILRVTAPNGESRDYIFEVIRTDEVDNSLLSDLQVGGYAINPGFREDVNYYTLAVGSDVSSLGVSATPKYGGAQVNITGNNKLNYGANYIKISVSGEEKMNTYVVEVIRQHEDAKLNIVPWIISGLLAILLIVTIVVLIFMNKLKNLEIKNAYLQNNSNDYYVYRNENHNGKIVKKKFRLIEEDEI